MKTASLTHPAHHLIDTAPLAARYEVMMAAILGFIAAGRLGDVLSLSHKVRRLVRVFTKLEAQNSLLTRKLKMLSHAPWRDCVLKELGGMRKLKLWEAAQKRIAERIEARQGRAANAMAAPEKEKEQEQDPAWLYTPERIAESERLKAHARMCISASVHPNVFRDRCKMDFDGLFRLAPLPREGLLSREELGGDQAARQVKIYTQNTIVDYDWNPVPFAKTQGFGPASIWPVEFYAAMGIEAEILAGRDASSPVIPALGLSHSEKPLEPGPNREYSSVKVGPASSTLRVSCGMTDGKITDAIKSGAIPLLSLRDTLSPKVYQDFFGSLTR